MQKNIFLFLFLLNFACQEGSKKEVLVRQAETETELWSSFVNQLAEGEPVVQSPFGAIRFSAKILPDSTLANLAISPNGQENAIFMSPFLPFQKNNIPNRFSAQTAEPAYYSISLANGIKMEATATQRLVFQRFTFPTDTAGLRFGAENIEVKNDSLLIFNQKNDVFVAVQFSKSFFKRDKENFYFLNPNSEALLVKTAMSSVNTEKAIKNLAEIKDWNFEICAEKTAELWENELQKIQVQTSDRSLKVQFYTKLWEALQTPVLLSDLDGSFRLDSVVYQAKGFEAYQYADPYDFQDLAPLLGLIKPEILQNIAKTYLLTQKLPRKLGSFDKMVLGLSPIFWAEELDFDQEKMGNLLTTLAFENKENLSPYALYSLAMFSKKLHSPNLENALPTAKILDSELGENLGLGAFGMMHNLQGYLGKIGGKEKLSAFLDGHFEKKQALNAQNQYFAYLYSATGEHWKTQEKIARISIDSLSSSTAVWRMLGFYPLNTLEGVFVWGNPVFEKITFQLAENQGFVFNIENTKSENKFIQTIQKNGVIWEKTYFSLKDWLEYCTWQIKMGNTPQKDFGTHEAHQPPSVE